MKAAADAEDKAEIRPSPGTIATVTEETIDHTTMARAVAESTQTEDSDFMDLFESIAVASENIRPLIDIIQSQSGTINAQEACPLFSKLPPEIRNMVFDLALTPFNDLKRPLPPGSYYHRPGNTHAQIIDTTLLCTCRRIYLETYSVPSSNYWVTYSGHGICRQPCCSIYPEYVSAAKRDHCAAREGVDPDSPCTRIRYFGPDLTLAWWVPFEIGQDKATELKMTICHADW